MRFYLMYGRTDIGADSNRSVFLRSNGLRMAINHSVGVYYYPDSPPFNSIKELKIKLRK